MKKLKEMTIGNVQPKIPGHLDDAVVASDIAKLRGVYGDDVDGAVVEFIEFYENCIDYDVPVRELLEYAAKGFNITIDEVKRIWHEEYPEDHSLDIDEKKVNNLGNNILESLGESIMDNGYETMEWNLDINGESDVPVKIEWKTQPAEPDVGVMQSYIDEYFVTVLATGDDVTDLFPKDQIEDIIETFGYDDDREDESDDERIPYDDMLGEGTKKPQSMKDALIKALDKPEKKLSKQEEQNRKEKNQKRWAKNPHNPANKKELGESKMSPIFENGKLVTTFAQFIGETELVKKYPINESAIKYVTLKLDDYHEEDEYKHILKIAGVTTGSRMTSNSSTLNKYCVHETTFMINLRNLKSSFEYRGEDYHDFPYVQQVLEKFGLIYNFRETTDSENWRGYTAVFNLENVVEPIQESINESDDSIGLCNDGSARDCYSVQERQAIYNAYKSVEDRFNWDGEDFVSLPGIKYDILPQHMMEIVDEFEGNTVNESKNNEVASLVESVAKIMRR